MIDLHCHILPGLDDGAQSFEESVAMAEIARSDGIRTIAATPHLFRDVVEGRDFEALEKTREELAGVLKAKNIAVDILPGAEVHISHRLVEEIRKNRNNLVINRSSYMFVEFPSDHIYSGVRELFFELMNEGIRPIIAHPERNRVFLRRPELLYELVQAGALAQVNAGSVTGQYGDSVKDAAIRFCELNFIHFLGSDGHNSRSKAPRLSPALIRLEQVMGKERARALVEENPLAVLEDRELSSLPEPVDPRQRAKKLRLPILFKTKSRKDGLRR